MSEEDGIKNPGAAAAAAAAVKDGPDSIIIDLVQDDHNKKRKADEIVASPSSREKKAKTTTASQPPSPSSPHKGGDHNPDLEHGGSSTMVDLASPDIVDFTGNDNRSQPEPEVTTVLQAGDGNGNTDKETPTKKRRDEKNTTTTTSTTPTIEWKTIDKFASASAPGDADNVDNPIDMDETTDLKAKDAQPNVDGTIGVEACGGTEGGSKEDPSAASKNSVAGSDEKKPVANKSDTTVKDEIPKGRRRAGPYESLKYAIVRNDGKPESLIKLVGLKTLFSRQLPKMPRAYIARLVFDRRHVSLAILNDDPATKDTDEEVIGAICYRPFYDMRFAEIAFCAVNASFQVKGYGSKLMNLVKQEAQRTNIEYFITYADNYAIGYFKKQGFQKNISMPKGRYQYVIKDYEGGTMMECFIHPGVDYTRVPEMVAAQREFALSRVRLKANSTTVYDALPPDWKPDLQGVSRANETAFRAMSIPGMVEAGWTMNDMMVATGQGKDQDRAKNALKSEMLAIVRKLEEKEFAWPFREPVDTNEVVDYLDVIKEPIDLSTIEKRIRKGDYYRSKKKLYLDLKLMINNCKLYNDEASTYVQCAVQLERYMRLIFPSPFDTRWSARNN